MGFFDMPPPDETDEDLQDEPDLEPEARWLGGVVPVEAFIGLSEQAAVGASKIIAYPDGFDLDVVAFVRRPERRRRHRFPMTHGPILQDHGYGLRDEDGAVAKDLVRFGVQFPDGGKVTNLDRTPMWPDATEPMHGMEGRSGSSSDGEAQQEFWIWPIPESGDIVLVCEWPAYGIAESSLTVSGEALRAAAARARLVWPEDPPGDRHGSSMSSARSRIARMRGRAAFGRMTARQDEARAAGADDAGAPDDGSGDQASD
jgi:hypothetical protein